MISRSFLLVAIRQRKALGLSVHRQKMPRQIRPDAIAIAYAEALQPFLDAARQLVDQEVRPLARRLLSHLDGEINDLLDKLSERFFANFPSFDLQEVARRFASRTSAWSKTELSRQLVAGLGIDLPLSDPRLAALIADFTAENVALVKSIPNQYFDQVEQLVTQAVRQGKRWDVLAEELSSRFGVAESSARFLARDQVSKFYSELNRVRQEDLGLTGYVWRTMNDNRTRPDHARREGKIFSWSSPPPGGHPGAAVGCRCYAEPDLSPLLRSS